MMFPNFTQLRDQLDRDFKTLSQVVQTEKWQSTNLDPSNPATTMHELMFVSIQVPLASSGFVLDNYRRDVKPNLPWADNHFEERVCGRPINPGTQWAQWPYGHSANKFRSGEKFNHNYMERYWPTYADASSPPSKTADDCVLSKQPLVGIRHPYGNLSDVVDLLHREPMTRQAFLPVWFPEDTGVVHGGRVPCTLGYHWLMRNYHLHTSYYIRSCDYIRHFNDDIYLTIRLTLWLIEELRQRDLKFWGLVKPGWFRMDIGSLHLFHNDYLMKFGQ